MENDNININSKVFIIGFNKCATTSIHRFFVDQNIESLHWREDNRYLAKAIMENIENSRDPLHSFSSQVYSDFTYVSEDFILEVDQIWIHLQRAYPSALFILNTRQTNDWVNSRLKHSDFANRYMVASKLSLRDVVDRWIEKKENHESAVLDFFSGAPNFFHFNIDRMGFVDFANWCSSRLRIKNVKEWRENITQA